MKKSHLFGTACACLFSLVYVSTVHSASIVLTDNFVGTSLDSAWMVTLTDTTGYVATVGNSRLTVTDIIDTSVNSGWSYVTLTQQFSPVSDFIVNFDFAYDSLDGGFQSNRAMQSIDIRLFDANGSTVVSAGMSDPYVEQTGRVASNIGGVQFQTSPGSMPTNLSINSLITRDALGNTNVTLGSSLNQTELTSAPIVGVDIRFGRYAHTGGSGSSFFGREWIEQIQVSGTAPAVVPVPAAIWLFTSGLLGLVGIARRKKSA